VSRIADLKPVADAILSRYSRGEWEKDHLVITDLVTAGTTTILISDGAPAQIDLLLTGKRSQPPTSLEGADVVVQRASNIAFQFIGRAGLTPLFRLAGVTHPLLRRARFEVRDQRRLRASA
jgi:hypothetical protein